MMSSFVLITGMNAPNASIIACVHLKRQKYEVIKHAANNRHGYADGFPAFINATSLNTFDAPMMKLESSPIPPVAANKSDYVFDKLHII